MQFIGMVATAKLEPAGLGVRPAAGHPAGHTIAFVQQHKTAFLIGDGVVDSDFTRGHKFVDMIMTTRGEVNIKNTAHASTIDDPDTDLVSSSSICPRR
jgi:hypothetical protein